MAVELCEIRKTRKLSLWPIQFPQVESPKTIVEKHEGKTRIVPSSLDSFLREIIRICLAVCDPPTISPKKYFGGMTIAQPNWGVSKEIKRRITTHNVGPPPILEKQPVRAIFERHAGGFRFERQLLVPRLDAENRADFLPVNQVIGK